MHLKKLFTGFILILFSLHTLSSQSCQAPACPTPSGSPDYVYPGNPPSNNVQPDELFIIESGTYTDNPNILPDATVWVKPGATWDVSGNLNQMKGTLIIEGYMEFDELVNVANPLSEVYICNGGELVVPNGGLTPKFPYYISSGGSMTVSGDMNMWDDDGSIDVFGTFTLTGNMSFNGGVDILNCTDGTIEIQGDVYMNDDDGSLENYGDLTIDGQLELNGSSPLVNYTGAVLTVDQLDINKDGSFENFGLVDVINLFNLNKTPELFNNSCSIISRDEMNIWDDIDNEGTLYASNSDHTASLTITGYVNNNNIIIADNLTLHTGMNGTNSHLYIYEESYHSSGTVTGSMNVYDATDANPNDEVYFDTQYGDTDPSVTNIAIIPPKEGDLISCPQSSGVQLLPVTWLETDAQQSGEEVIVSWSTADETDNKQFEIERYDETDEVWIRIGTVSPDDGGERTSTYTFEDAHPRPGQNMYRIKQVDFDGRYSYSDCVVVLFRSSSTPEEQAVDVYPNPSRGQLYINYLSKTEQTVHVEIMNRIGIIYKRFSLKFNKGSNRIQLPDLSHLTGGMYWIHLQMENGRSEQIQFIKS